MVQFMHFSSSLLSLCDIHLVGAKEFWPLQLYMMALSIQVLFSGVRLSYKSLMVNLLSTSSIPSKLRYTIISLIVLPPPYKDTYMWVVYGLVCLEEWMPYRHVFKGDCIACLEYDKNRRFSSLHNRCNFKNIYHNYMCLKEVGLYAQNMRNYSRVNSQHNWGDLMTTLKSNGHFVMNRIFLWAPKIIRNVSKWTWSWCGFVDHLVVTDCFIS